MKSTLIRATALLSLVAAPAFAVAPVQSAPLDTVVFAGGCFWGVQAVFQHVNGVVTATSGYAGGRATKPSYEEVSTGNTGHAESVRVVYDPAKVSYTKLLDVFFTVAHDPTELNRQGPDRGTQYRSALFFTNEAQKNAANAYIAQLVKRGEKVVTQVAPLNGFYQAEGYHQDYATLHPNDPYIYYNDAPKVAALKKQYASLWTDKLAAH
ncbi:MAG: peptide-methionine (S)-S-oxide reductase MsrA [Gemmatimonadota bacterium]|nr:peptide-methionine (S)-S-oxide reductase MsrA [Gemmatimonadota bacterium]